ncbi:MAG: 16S rRNA (guanine527-N7)-methyltransferase [Bradymonadia bacterium]
MSAHKHVERCLRGAELSVDFVDGLALFCELLAFHGKRSNLVGTQDLSRISDEIVVDSVRLCALVKRQEGTLVDIGAGAGIPVIPILIAMPGWTGVAVEPREKRRAFMMLARRKLGLRERLEIVSGRLEEDGTLSGEASSDRRFDLAVTKAVFAPTEWARRASGLLSPDGQVGIYASAEAGLPHTAQRIEYTTESGSARLIGVI